eukprot:CAMPEP_0197598198 /NCGR_PEP_ID=MMETSP1326-20131121/28825_1 /TAXON_ID=1155430 /ORGANISM="Genus nov. species nov., Strain RCC2288" /LENGTH=340 /DNA_ID=CAMNT_0043164971 /DNA_START=86 /DNA_END=1109 /DNA_ORIENTATION=+
MLLCHRALAARSFAAARLALTASFISLLFAAVAAASAAFAAATGSGGGGGGGGCSGGTGGGAGGGAGGSGAGGAGGGGGGGGGGGKGGGGGGGAFSRKFSQPGVHTACIDDVNMRLRALAGGSGGSVAYVECKQAFLTADGTAIIPNLMRDVLHPSSEGMERWFEVLQPAIEALRAAPAPRDSWYHGAHVTPASENGTLKSIEPGVRLALSRLIAWSPHALCVCDMRLKDHPIIYANDNFYVQTGFPPQEVLNHNCRFMQGPGTDPETVKKMGECFKKGEEFSGRVVNYHKNGTTLINSLVMSPLRDATGAVTHYIGIQRLASADALADAPAEYQFRAAL